MSEISVTWIMAYYENPSMLEIQWSDWNQLPGALRARTRLIVVDDGSPDHPARLRAHPAVQVFRMSVDVPWNQDACRNVGVMHAETDWILMTDMDHRIPSETWEYVLSGHPWKNNVAYFFGRVSAPEMKPYKPHPNSWLMSKHLFEIVGGYDERLAGHYGTDGDFKVRLSAAARRLQQLPVPLVRVGREVVPDASTTRYARKLPEDKLAVSRILKERALEQNQRPVRYRFPYERVS